MTRPRAPLSVVLPAPLPKYDPAHQAETLRSIEQHFAKMQPLQTRQTVTGAKGGNAALASLLTALANLGFIIDSTT